MPAQELVRGRRPLGLRDEHLPHCLPPSQLGRPWGGSRLGGLSSLPPRPLATGTDPSRSPAGSLAFPQKARARTLPCGKLWGRWGLRRVSLNPLLSAEAPGSWPSAVISVLSCPFLAGCRGRERTAGGLWGRCQSALKVPQKSAMKYPVRRCPVPSALCPRLLPSLLHRVTRSIARTPRSHPSVSCPGWVRAEPQRKGAPSSKLCSDERQRPVRARRSVSRDRGTPHFPGGRGWGRRAGWVGLSQPL